MKNTRKKRRYEKQKIRPSLKIGVLITVLVLVVLAAGILMFPAFDVSEVYCQGNSNISNEEILAEARLEIGKNTFLQNVGGAKSRISKMPLIEEVNISRVFPNKICINVVERCPAMYIAMGEIMVALDINRVVVKEYDKIDMKRLLDKTQISLKEEDENKENEDEPQKDETEGGEIQQESEAVFLNIPFVNGIELSDARLSKTAKSKDESKLDELFVLLDALKQAELLNRTTYIDITDSNNIIFMIENRLEVHFKNIENAKYRSEFLKEVINTKLSAYERSIVDYTGDDIYVRPPSDNKAKMAKKEDAPTDEDEADAVNLAEDEDEDEQGEGVEKTQPEEVDISL